MPEGIAFSLRSIKLKEDANQFEFERFMLQELFPSTDTSEGDQESDQHFLLDGDSSREYIWMSRLRYFIHQTPIPTWLSDRVNKMHEDAEERLTVYGSGISSELHFDVASWRKILGEPT